MFRIHCKTPKSYCAMRNQFMHLPPPSKHKDCVRAFVFGWFVKRRAREVVLLYKNMSVINRPGVYFLHSPLLQCTECSGLECLIPLFLIGTKQQHMASDGQSHSRVQANPSAVMSRLF